MDNDKQIYDFIVIGGGASGFFGAINIARLGKKVIILEKFQKVLTKLAVSGGGRCNVTHHLYDPKNLTLSYPRGFKALLGPFHKFGPQDMIAWLEQAGVKLKIESDGRIFPITDSSQTIIDCFIQESIKAGVIIEKGVVVDDITLSEPISSVHTNKGIFQGNHILVATGSSKGMWDVLARLGHKIVPQSPSLFALNTPGSFFNELSGISLPKATLSFKNYSFTGPLLFTHFGLSGPVALKLSSFAAVDFQNTDYKATLTLDLCPEYSDQDLMDILTEDKKPLSQINLGFPKRLWEALILHLKFDRLKPLNHMPKTLKVAFINALKRSVIKMDGKTTHKEEFVTAGGIDTNEVNFSNMQSKLHPQLFFAGEVLNIDGITGGFNFQAAWTTSYLVSAYIAKQ